MKRIRARLDGRTLLAGAALLVLALITALTARPGPQQASFDSADYAPGGYRAWSELLAREGIATARFVRRPIELDAQTDTLVSAQPVGITGTSGERTVADLAALAAWVRRGGRLVYLGTSLDLSQGESRELGLPVRIPARGGAAGVLCGPWSDLVGTLSISSRVRLPDVRAATLLCDRGGALVVRLVLGKGEVIAVWDPMPFTNGAIGTAANARLAYLLGSPRQTGGTVAFDDGLHGALVGRPWYRALPVPVRVALTIAAVALLGGLVGSALGNGPAIRLLPPREPTSLEFVEALAALHERIGARERAFSILVHDARAALRRRTRADEAERELDALEHAPPTTDADLVAGARRVATLRKEHSHGGTRGDRRAAFAGGHRTHRRR